MTSVGSMGDEARKRKERLRALKEKRNPNSTQGIVATDGVSNIENEPLPKPVFRSYKPQDETLKESALPQVKPTDVTDKVSAQLEASQITSVIDEVDLANLAPRKPDWDLKRDVAKKLEKLEKRTQRAIAELIRERLKASNEDLASVVNAGGAIARTADEDEDD